MLAPAIQEGKITRDQVRALYSSGWLKANDPRAGLEKNVKSFLGISRKPPLTDAHHDLPIEFELRFLQAGLDPNQGELGRFINNAKHDTWSWGKKLLGGGPFNQAWRQFFGAHPNATAAEILQFMDDLRSGVPQTIRKLDGTTAVWTFQ